MNLDSFIQDLLNQDDIELTEAQAEGLSIFWDFHKTESERAAFLLSGSAGTGKTFLIDIMGRILRKEGYKVVLLAPTGRAAKVISRRTSRQAFTIHHHIYAVGDDFYGNPSFALKDNKEKQRMVYIIDEASMVGEGGDGSTRRGMLMDLLAFVYENDPFRKIIFVGDPVQLPPIGHPDSPALDADYLRDKGNLYLYVSHLSEVKRQEFDSEVLANAKLIRSAFLEDEHEGLELQMGREVQSLETAWEAIENYLGYYSEGDHDRVVFITYSNYRAVQVNQAVRHQLFFEEQALVLGGDLLMVVKNNYSWGDEKRLPFIANGEMCTVRAVHEETLEERYGLKWVNADLEFWDVHQEPILIECKLMLDLLLDKRAQLPNETLHSIQTQRRAEYFHLPKGEQASLMRKDPYVNALQVKYGYAITGHKSQGGQWENVIIGFEPDYGQNMNAYVRWAYTVFTRAEERVFLLDCPFVKV